MADNKKGLPAKELAAFFESLSMLLQAGVPANECPGIIAADMESGPLAREAKKLEDTLNGGEVFALSEAMEKGGAFPRYAIDMIQLGEESGRIETTAISLGGYYRRQDQLQQNIRNAISGPLLLLIIMGVVLVFLLFFVLPVFESVFASLGLASGGGVGGAFLAARIAMGVVGLLLLAVLVVVVMYLAPGGGDRLGRLMESFPLTRKIYYNISASRLANALEMLLASGIGADEALDKASVLVTNRYISDKIPEALEAVRQGEDLANSLVEAGVLVGFEAKVLLSASRAGQTETAMKKLAELYNDEADDGIDRLLGLVEPTLVGVLSVAIGVILLSVMLPLTSIMSTIS